jgi:hypothetical protein
MNHLRLVGDLGRLACAHADDRTEELKADLRAAVHAELLIGLAIPSRIIRLTPTSKGLA